MWLLIHARIQIQLCWWKGPLLSSPSFFSTRIVCMWSNFILSEGCKICRVFCCIYTNSDSALLIKYDFKLQKSINIISHHNKNDYASCYLSTEIKRIMFNGDAWCKDYQLIKQWTMFKMPPGCYQIIASGLTEPRKAIAMYQYLCWVLNWITFYPLSIVTRYRFYISTISTLETFLNANATFLHIQYILTFGKLIRWVPFSLQRKYTCI